MSITTIETQKKLRQTISRLIGVAMVIVMILGLAAAFRNMPAANAAVNPGLDSGNATVDTTTVPGQTILMYKTTGSSTFKAPAGATNVSILVVGGGGGGGSNGGGGGGGRVVSAPSMTVTPGVALAITVGGGGGGGTPSAGFGTNGNQSAIASLAVAPGGGGGGGNTAGGGIPGRNGGSGGGVGRDNQNANNTGGGLGNQTGTVPSGGAGSGNNGGNSTCSTNWCGGGGGGGAAGAGTNASGNNAESGEIAGNGGSGILNDITGSSVARYGAGGGGGRHSNGTVGAGGAGGGGAGSVASATGGAGTVNTGSGGGGGGYGGTGGAGGSGMVVIRFTTQTSVSIAGVSGLAMWYKADGAGNTNALWNDVSGLGFNMTQATAGKQPVLTTNGLNFNPAYVFDGTDDAFSMSTHGVGASDTMSSFYAASLTDPSGGYRYLTEFGDDTPSLSINNGKPNLYARGTSPVSTEYSTIEALSPRIYSFVSPTVAGTRIVGVNNKEETGTYTGGYSTSTGATGTVFGAPNVSSGKSFKGPIGEAMFFSRQLTAQERQRINSYLAVKYGVTLYQGASGATYVDSASATIWPADATYKNTITGIGRDDASTLNQKQSKNVDDIVTVGRGDIAASNQANANTFAADKTFLLWGHNGGVIDQATTVTGTNYMRMGRIWKSVTTGTVGTVKLQIPKSEIVRSTASLFISNDATFNNTSTRVDMTSNGSNYEAVVTLPAGAYFTFGSLAGSDLQFISKTATNSANGAITSYTPGESIKYILKVKNNGPDAAGTVTATDTLPAGVIPVSATGSGWNCGTPSGQTVTCTLNSLNSGATASDITIEANIASSTTGTKANTATATTANDPDSSNNSASVSLTAAPKADLSIAKGHTGTPTAGNPHTYTFSVTNNGPADVSSFTVSDTLDSNLTYASSTGGVSCTGSTTVTCTSTAPLTTGQTRSFTIVVNVSASYAGGEIDNTATVSVPVGTTDPNAANNSSTDRSTVFVDTDLGVTKSHTGNFTAGVNNDFKLSVANQGPSNAPIGAVTLTDTLDDDFTFVSATGTGWNCTGTDGTVTCTNTAVINAGDTAPDVTLTVLVDSVAKGSAPNTAEVTSTTPDSDLTDNTSTDTPTIISDADLAIVKTHVGTAFTAGQQEQYTFTVSNNGPSADAPSYSITDTLPTGVTFVSGAGAASCAAVGQNVTCTGGGIAAGAADQVTTITVAVAGNVTGTLANTANIAVAPGTTDPDMSNNSSTDNAPVEPNADLSIVKTHAGNLTAGADETYTFTVNNNGPSDVSSYTITDTLDGNLTYKSSSAGLSCSGTTTITCTGGAITSGNQAVVTVTVTVNSAAASGSTIANTATVATPNGVNDPNMSNNSSTVSNTVVASADLSVSKTHTGNFTAGANTSDFTITVTNNGPSDASTFTVTDILPTNMSYVSASGTGVNCSNSGQTVTCSYGPTISAGQSVNATLTVAVNANIAGGTTLNNTASVSSATSDPNMANNSDTDTVDIDSSADLAIVKTLDTPDFTAGNNERFKFTVTNNGPSDASSFTISDVLDSDLTYQSSSSNISCTGTTTLTCTGGAIDSGDTFVATITVAVAPSVTAGTAITNTATVATVAPTTDPNMANNSSTVIATIVNSTDLAITKNATGTFTAGETGNYTISVENNGPSDTPTNDVTVSDTLPAGLTLGSYTGTGWSCTGTTAVTCVYAPALVNGATAPDLTLTANIAADKLGTIVNTATVSSTTDDPNPANDSDSATANIVAEADLTATKIAQGPLTAGEAVTYHFDVSNSTGPSIADGVKITDNLDGHFTYQSFSGNGWDCSEASGTVTCDYDNVLGVGDSTGVDVTLLVAADVPDPLDNTASVTFDGTDPTPANPSDTEPVSYSADLEVKVTHESATYHSGEKVKYTYTVINHGPSRAKDVVLKDTLPSGLTFDNIVAGAGRDTSVLAAIGNYLMPTASAAPNTPFSCANSGQEVTCNASTLSVGTYIITMEATIASNFTGNLTSVANITSSTPDPNMANNTSTDTIANVTSANGLADTGQNILAWIGLTISLIIAAITSLLIYRKKVRQS